ncbi:hypothetical protein BDA99DRAFT_603510 [Phascolomyces articulosus]|uniref:Uncharacterized protein n=1 Tax=Phascolomyces articulosus TaxID=60185 RepID=A0AAD5PFP3_9FUNG|nr:hypothetical protein BDA99DRAFT_603510 [Phascolomyces articulosus]
MTISTPLSTTTTTTVTKPSSSATTVSLDVADLIRILQVQIPQLHNESIVYEHKAQMEDTKEQYRLLCKETDSLRKKLLAVIQDNNNHRKTQERMESQIYIQQQELAQLHKESQALTRQRKHLEKRLEDELQNYESDRLLWQQRESDLSTEVKRWSVHERVGNGKQQYPRRTRSATASNIWGRTNNSLPDLQCWNTIPNNSNMSTLFEERTKTVDGIAARDTKIRAQEKLISDFKSEVEQQKRVIHEAVLAAEAQVQRIDILEQELESLKEVNASLMEDNESYQVLLHEKTMAGEFPKKADLATVIPSEGSSATVADTISITMNNNNTSKTAPDMSSLAAELNKVQIVDDCTCKHGATVQKLSDEIRVLQESNKALSLYMNKILLKIIDNQELVDVLNIDEDDEQSTTFKNNLPTAPALPASNNKKDMTHSPSLTTTSPSFTTTSITANNSRPRRSTVSSWISASKQPVTGESPTAIGRHRSHTNNDASTHQGNSNGGWSRALKRMTVIGWSSKDSTNNNNNSNSNSTSSNNNNISNCNSGNTITPANHDSAISSCNSIMEE